MNKVNAKSHNKTIKRVINEPTTVLNIEKRQNQIPELWNFIIGRKEKDKPSQTHMWFGANFDKVMFKVDDEDYEEFVNLVAKNTKNYVMKKGILERTG